MAACASVHIIVGKLQAHVPLDAHAPEGEERTFEQQHGQSET
jgi:hypothetical protein